MKLSPQLQSSFYAAQRGAAAFALSGLLLLPALGPVPPVLADGDVSSLPPPSFIVDRPVP